MSEFDGRDACQPSGRVRSLGWYVIFGHASLMEQMRAYYQNVLQLPLYLNWRRREGRIEDKDHFWAGEAIILDINYDGTEIAPPSRQAAVFRVHGLADLVREIRGRGGSVSDPVPDDYGQTAYVTDPMGQLIGLREMPPAAALPADHEAQRRWARGEAFNPGCRSMPPGWQELGWVQLRAADPCRLARFYSEAYGLNETDRTPGTILLDLHDHVALEFVAGGNCRPAPTRQMASTATVILRVDNLDQIVVRALACGGTLAGEPYDTPKGRWLYIVDPEGNVVGLSEWNHPSVYRDTHAVVPEDVEAARRAAEARAAN